MTHYEVIKYFIMSHDGGFISWRWWHLIGVSDFSFTQKCCANFNTLRLPAGDKHSDRSCWAPAAPTSSSQAGEQWHVVGPCSQFRCGGHFAGLTLWWRGSSKLLSSWLRDRHFCVYCNVFQMYSTAARWWNTSASGLWNKKVILAATLCHVVRKYDPAINLDS